MNTEQIFSICWAIAFFILGMVILFGKGDKLIAGYNTASEEERQKVDIVRLRGVTTFICLLSAVFLPVISYFDDYRSFITTGYILIVIVSIIVANTWAKKKGVSK